MKPSQKPPEWLPFCIVVFLLVALPACASAAPSLALRFTAPAEVTASRGEAMTSARLPVGPFADGKIATRLAEGVLDEIAWRIAAPDASTLQLLQPLRAQIAAAGFTVIFECETEMCGGFDFRYAVALLPEPDMHVDLSDFRYLAASRDGLGGPEYLSLMVSKSIDDGFVQLTQILQVPASIQPLVDATQLPLDRQSAAEAPALTQPGTSAAAESPGGTTGRFAHDLSLGLSLALEDLVFPSGSSTLAEGDYPSLVGLSEWLRANPSRQVTLVGHTDASGGLAGNIALSKQRAQSVQQRLVSIFDIPSGQIMAEGVGYLAPRDTNLTELGKQRNRRVEVVMTSTR